MGKHKPACPRSGQGSLCKCHELCDVCGREPATINDGDRYICGSCYNENRYHPAMDITP